VTAPTLRDSLYDTWTEAYILEMGGEHSKGAGEQGVEMAALPSAATPAAPTDPVHRPSRFHEEMRADGKQDLAIVWSWSS